MASQCDEAAAPRLLVITRQSSLMSFDPSSARFTSLFHIDCPVQLGVTPFSMAVSRSGTAYVVFTDGDLFEVDTNTSSCRAPGHTVGPSFGSTFGMTFVPSKATGVDDLYLVSANTGSDPSRLAILDTGTYQLNIVGDFRPPPANQAELTGTGARDLFAFYTPAGADVSAMGRINLQTGQIVEQSVLPGITQGFDWAFAFWGGSFYFFTSPDGTGTVVDRFRTSDGSITRVGRVDETVVGAGASTCAPQQ